MDERAFKGVWIPAAAWNNAELTIVERVILAEIDSWTGQGKACFRTNANFAEWAGIGERTISRIIAKLLRLKLVKNVGRRGQRRELVCVDPRQYGDPPEGTPRQNGDGTPRQNGDHTNTDPTNTVTPSLRSGGEGGQRGEPPGGEIERQLWDDVREAFVRGFEADGMNRDQIRWQVQGGHTKKLIKRFMKEPDPVAFADRMLRTLWGLRTGQLVNGREAAFWQSQPFLPSTLNSEGLYTRVYQAMTKLEREATEDVSWARGTFK